MRFSSVAASCALLALATLFNMPVTLAEDVISTEQIKQLLQRELGEDGGTTMVVEAGVRHI